MSFTGEISPADIAKLNRTMSALPKALRNKAIRKALRAGAKIVQAEAKKRAPRKTGATAKAIKVRSAKRSRTRVAILVQVGEKAFTGDTFYAAFVEYGHHVGHRRLGSARKFVPGQEWMKKSFEAKKKEASRAIIDTMKTELAKVANELRK